MTAEYQKMLKAYHKRCLFMILKKENSLFVDDPFELLDFVTGLRIESLDKNTFAVFDDNDDMGGIASQYWLTDDGHLLRVEEIPFKEV